MEKKLCIVTGAAGGIGSSIGETFLENDYHVVLVDVSADKLKEKISECGFDQNDVTVMAADITSEEEVKALVEQVAEKYGRIDALVNAAGICGEYDRVADCSFDNFRRIYEVNVFGTFLMIRYVLKQMEKQGKGAIVNVGSISGMRGYSFEIGYGSSKWAVIGMSQTVANEYGKKGIRCNSVSPGWVDTSMMEKTLENYKRLGVEDPTSWIRFGSINRPADPKEVAEAICFLCSDKASYINGTNLVVDGGMMAK